MQLSSGEMRLLRSGAFDSHKGSCMLNSNTPVHVGPENHVFLYGIVNVAPPAVDRIGPRWLVIVTQKRNDGGRLGGTLLT